VRRETSEQVVARLERKARPRIAADTRLVLSFGANDATLEEDRVRVAPDGSVAALEAALGPWLAEVRAGDGAHPGAGGYTELAAVVRAPFLAWLRSARL
jgi:acyl-CoA thioesterase I